MSKVILSTPRKIPGLRHPIEIGYRFMVLALICCCATARVKNADVPQQPREVPPEDLICARDTDCEILDDDVSRDECCGHNPEEPYPISRAAVERYQARDKAKCADAMCNKMLVKGGCRTIPQD
jgi:hypothetical protein